jgi:ketosteroid isomerase-like protein
VGHFSASRSRPAYGLVRPTGADLKGAQVQDYGQADGTTVGRLQEKMMSEASQKRLQLAEQFVASIGRADVDGAVRLLSTNVVYRVEGVHPLAGSFSAAEVMGHLQMLIQRTSGTMDATKFEDWLTGEHYVGCVVQVTFHAKRRRFSGRVFYLMKFDTADLIERFTVFFEDAEALSRFLGD